MEVSRTNHEKHDIDSQTHDREDERQRDEETRHGESFECCRKKKRNRGSAVAD